MNYFFLYCALSFSFLSVAQDNQISNFKIANGEWILVSYDTRDSINVISKNKVDNAIAVSATEPDQDINVQYQRISLKSYLQKDLIDGTTKFIFRENNTFEFYRKEKLTFSGTYVIKDKALILKYKSGDTTSEKNNTIIKADHSNLTIVSESHNHPVTFFFHKK